MDPENLDTDLPMEPAKTWVPGMPEPAGPAETPAESDRRIFGRIQPYWVQCDLGYILDISARGVRLLTKRKLRGYVKMRLWDGRVGLTHQAEVVWTKRVRFRQHEAGLRFVDLGPEVAQTLAILAANFHE
jgi:hypothetical protein